MALTVGVGTVMDAREVMILITGSHKAFALYKAIEEGKICVIKSGIAIEEGKIYIIKSGIETCNIFIKSILLEIEERRNKS